MADDKMKRDDLGHNAGNQKDMGTGQQSPGRNPQSDQSTSQRSGSGSQTRHGDSGNEGRGGRQGDDDQRR